MKELEEIISIGADGIDVARVMERLQERIRSQVAAPEYQELSMEELEKRWELVEEELRGDPIQELSMAIQFAKTYADVSSAYMVASRKKVIGPLVVLVKRVVRKLLKPYLDAVFSQQNEFNRQLVEVLENLKELVLAERSLEYPGKLDRLAFYQRWGEDFDRVVERLRPVAEIFSADDEIVNLFAGRGEFLQACRETGRKAEGVEGETGLVKYMQERQLRAIHLDPLVFMEQAPFESLSAVFVMGLGERMSHQELRYAVNLLGDKMGRDGRLLILNHHPRTFFGGEAAYRDPTVLRLVHPEAMSFLLESAGFARVEFSPFGQRGDREEKERRKLKRQLEQMESEWPGISRAMSESLEPPFYLVEARR
jgi:hypothetical protein